MNGFTTIGITPELLAMMGDDWSEPVQIRATRRQNGALDLEFRKPFAAPIPSDLNPSEEIRLGRAKVRAAQRATDQ